MSEKVQQLESQIQGKLDQARERRETIEREQKEKLRNHVSIFFHNLLNNHSIKMKIKN